MKEPRKSSNLKQLIKNTNKEQQITGAGREPIMMNEEGSELNQFFKTERGPK